MRAAAILTADHPLVASADAPRCPGCAARFRAGDAITLIPIGPGADPDARQRARDGRPYNALALAAHVACVTGEEGA